MAKLNVKDIAELLAQKKNMDQADAENYIESFFSLISEAMISEKIVKIKGLGTFKLVEVRDRESVDVNTGERVVIDGHSKMSFVPDNTLKELVNKPFSQFDTVVLNDGVDFENDSQPSDDGNISTTNSDKKDTSADEIGSETVESNGNSDVPNLITGALHEAVSELNSATEQQKNESADSETDKKESADAEMTTADSIESGSEISTDSLPVNDMPVGESVSEDFSDSETAVNTNTEESRLNQEETDVEGDNTYDRGVENSCADGETSFPTDKKHGSSLVIKIGGVAASVVLVVLIFLGGFYFGEKSSRVAVIDKRPKAHIVVRKTSPKKTVPTKGVDLDTIARKDSIKEKDEKINSSQETEETVSGDFSKQMEMAQREVKTGAYTIDGLDRTVKVKSGQTLSSISRFYLGEGMECYIKVFNNRVDLREGETVKIPKLKLKKNTTNKKVS